MKRLAVVALVLALPMWAQNVTINLDHLAAKAKKKTEVTLEGDALEAVKKLAPEQAEKLKDISRVYIRTFEFEKPGEFTDADLAAVRQQGTGAGWSKLISVKEEKEATDISLYMQGGQIRGLLLIAAEETELTVIHIVGPVDLARMTEVVASTVSFDMDSIKNLQGQ